MTNTYIIGDMNIDLLKPTPTNNHLRSILTLITLLMCVPATNCKTYTDYVKFENPHRPDNNKCRRQSNWVWQHNMRNSLPQLDTLKGIKIIKSRAFPTCDQNDPTLSNPIDVQIYTWPWWIFDIIKNLDKSFEYFIGSFQLLQNKIAPIKNVRARKIRPKWLTNEYGTIIQARNKAKSYEILNNSSETWQNYKTLGNVHLKVV